MKASLLIAAAWILTAKASALSALQADCQPSWKPTFGGVPGPTSQVEAMTVFDDGNGPRLVAGDVESDGFVWTPLRHVEGAILDLLAFDDGGGTQLYACGTFLITDGVQVNHIARWNGASWAALGGGLEGAEANALATFDDGSGPALYAAGRFTLADGSPVNRIAKWNGASWSPLGNGINGTVYDLAVFDDGSGPALYAGGAFSSAGVVAASNIARWDGSSWASVGSGTDDSVRALAVYDDGSGGGPALYAGGLFGVAGGVSASRIARWDGASWSPLGAGTSGSVRALTVMDVGGGPVLVAGGNFTLAGGLPANRIARWNGASWASFGSGLSFTVLALAVFDDGSGGGPKLLAGGSASPFQWLRQWNGSSWGAVPASGVDNAVSALQVFDDGSGAGPALYAGGYFTNTGGVTTHDVARWDGASWSPLGTGTEASREVSALATFDDGSGDALYAGGGFTRVSGVPANRIAKWNGTRWSPLGSGLNGEARSLAVYDDGTGDALYVGGFFSNAGGVSVGRIAKWNGVAWSKLGGGTNGSIVDALTVFDDGTGPGLYAGGDFTGAGGPANRIARWNGASWSQLGLGVNSYVNSLAVFDDGSGGGPALYVGGDFTSAGGQSMGRIARWDGTVWSQVGSVFGMDGPVYALAVFDDGLGSALYATGSFRNVDGLPASGIAKWNGTSWSALGDGLSAHGIATGYGTALTAFDDGGGAGPALYVGGSFVAFDSGDGNLARWGFVPDTTPPEIFCPSSMFVADRFGSPPGEVVHFSVTATDCRTRSPSVVCVPPSGSLFPIGRTLVTCTATDGAGNRSTCQFTITVARGIRPP